MSKSPLSGAFAGSSEPAKKNKKNGALLLISGIALATSIGGVFAANSIAINDTNTVEFGQGLAAVAVCSEDAETSMTQEYRDTEDFYVEDVTVTIPSANRTACEGVSVTVSVVVDTAGTITVETATSQVLTSSGVLTFDFADEDIIAGNVTDVAVAVAN